MQNYYFMVKNVNHIKNI